MNLETPRTPALQSKIDDALAAVVQRAKEIAQAKENCPKDLCAVGQLVLKIREHLADAAAPGAAPGQKGGTMSPETLQTIEDGIRML